MISRKLIRIKAVQALYSHVVNGDNSVAVSSKNLTHSIEKCYELYHLMLTMPCEVANYSRTIIDGARNKKLATNEDMNPNMRFVENPILEYLDASDELNAFIAKRGLSWQNNYEVIKSLYNSIMESDYYSEYMAKEKCTFGDSKNLITTIYKKEIEDFDFLHDDLEDMSIFWAADVEYAASHALSTISKLTEKQVAEGEPIELQPLFRDENDLNFAQRLFVKAAAEKSSMLDYIDTFTENWEVERIALMDRLIMVMALTEIKYIDEVPINVTFNEYIEIAKYFSTTRSKTFINGVLDKIVADMKSKGDLSPLKMV